MRYGLAITNAISALDLASLAEDAEVAGWDGVFYWDGGWNDAWIALTLCNHHAYRYGWLEERRGRRFVGQHTGMEQ